MKTTRTLLALALTSPLYLASMLFVRHPFTRTWEDSLCSLFGR